MWDALGIGPHWQRRLPADAGTAEVRARGRGTAAHEPPHPQASAAVPTALDWEGLAAAVAACTACGLCKTRRQTVFGAGLRGAHTMVIGEAPGAEEDASGEPFVGQAGRLLDQMLTTIRLSRSAQAPADAVYIANVLKCRPPGNRNPTPEEVTLCEPFLSRQVALAQPRLVIIMGRFAAQALLRTEASIAALRGKVQRVRVAERNVPVIVTYHPAYLLRNLPDKAKAWADLCLVRDVLDKDPNLTPDSSTA